MKTAAIPVLCLLALALSCPAALTTDRVIVVCNSSVEAYSEALEGIRLSFGRQPETVNPAEGGEAALSALARRDTGKVFIAVGRDALHAVSAAKVAAPVISTMMLREDAAAEGGPSGGEVSLNVPPRLLLETLQPLFLHKTRLGILVAGQDDRSSLTARGRELGFSVDLVEVDGPQNLLKAFLSFKGKEDLVLVLPNSLLYNSATVKPLILASLENRLPIVGFSPAFVRAGAAVGIFGDYREAGRQAAEMAQRYEPGRGQRSVESPRKLIVAVNQRVLRLLGLDYDHAANVEVYR